MKQFISLVFLYFMIHGAYAQGVSVSPSGTPADPSAAMDLNYEKQSLQHSRRA